MEKIGKLCIYKETMKDNQLNDSCIVQLNKIFKPISKVKPFDVKHNPSPPSSPALSQQSYTRPSGTDKDKTCHTLYKMLHKCVL